MSRPPLETDPYYGPLFAFIRGLGRHGRFGKTLAWLALAVMVAGITIGAVRAISAVLT